MLFKDFVFLHRIIFSKCLPDCVQLLLRQYGRAFCRGYRRSLMIKKLAKRRDNTHRHALRNCARLYLMDVRETTGEATRSSVIPKRARTVRLRTRAWHVLVCTTERNKEGTGRGQRGGGESVAHQGKREKSARMRRGGMGGGGEVEGVRAQFLPEHRSGE